ncbi:MAG: tetratricopeptide repeat protein [Gemmatimonadota bacterium]
MAALARAGFAWALAAAFGTGAYATQVAAQDRLARAEDFLWEGDADAARRELARWFETSERTAPGAARGRALLLRARLSADPVAAERDYLEVVHAYPRSPAAPEALLRLGQWVLAKGETDRAVSYLDRLVSDHPGWRGRDEALLWLARALHAQGRRRDACRVAQGAARSADPSVARLARAEAARCR